MDSNIQRDYFHLHLSLIIIILIYIKVNTFWTIFIFRNFAQLELFHITVLVDTARVHDDEVGRRNHHGRRAVRRAAQGGGEAGWLVEDTRTDHSVRVWRIGRERRWKNARWTIPEDPVKFREDLIRVDRTTLSLKLLTYQMEHFAEVAVDVSAYSRPKARLTRRNARRERMPNRSERSARERASRVSFVPLELFSGKDMRNHHPSRNERNASEIFENGFPSQHTDRRSNDTSS